MPETLALNAAEFPRCCDRCFHSPERPCRDLVACLESGPLCHEDDACAAKLTARREAAMRLTGGNAVVYVGTGTCGLGAGAAKTLRAVRAWLHEHSHEAEIVEVGCIGICSYEPLVDVQLPGRARLSFSRVTEEAVEPLLTSLFNGEVPRELLLGQQRGEGGEPWPDLPYLDEHPFFAPQTRWVLANCGIANPDSIEEYLARGGYRALARALRDRTPRRSSRRSRRAACAGGAAAAS